ncbi:MAG: hypothetical protein MUF45_05130 [Spirosomaceae bacterium]|jgi:hypothetical protein|nr:hypothetical protein [Spirosomataceae bacterium]
MKTLTIITNIIMILAFFPAAFAVMMSPMIFDSGATTRTWTIFFSIIAIPVSILITQIISWILFSKNNYDLAFKISLIPIIFVVLLVVLFLKSDSLT